MPVIKVKANGVADESLLDQIMSAANKATPDHVNPQAATIIRDANGKLVEVNVGLPVDVAHSDLENAKKAISEHSGVATAISFPIVNTEGFENTGWTDYQDITNLEIDLAGVKVVPKAYTSARAEATSAVEAIAGTKSIAMLNPNRTASTYDYTVSGIECSAASNGMTFFSSYTWSLKAKLAQTYNGEAMDSGNTTFAIYRIQTPFGNIESLNGGTWKLHSANGTEVDTGKALTDELHFEFELSPLGLTTLREKNSGTSVSYDYGFSTNPSNISMNFMSQENYSSSVLRKPMPLIVDEVSLTITSGS